MERQIELQLRMPNGKFQKFIQDFIPFSKRHDYIRLERELESKAKKSKSQLSELDYEEIQAEFVASLFDDEVVTKQLILDGLDTLDKTLILEIIRYRVLGFNKEEDEKIKKALTEETLAGVNSTTSN